MTNTNLSSTNFTTVQIVMRWILFGTTIFNLIFSMIIVFSYIGAIDSILNSLNDLVKQDLQHSQSLSGAMYSLLIKATRATLST